jgi:putative membrane protein
MTRTLVRIGLSLAGNAIGLLVASLLLDKMDVSGAAFLIAVVIFTVLTVVIEPLIVKLTSSKAEALEGASALITTLLALIITALLSDGLSIDGAGTWILATVIVWIVTLIAGVVLARLVLKGATDAK